MTDPLLAQRILAEQARDAHVRWLLAALDVDCVLDVGANRGQFATSLRSGGYTGRLVSFEPAGSPRAELEAAMAGDPDWRVRPWALGDSPGTAVLHGPRESELGSLLAVSEFGRAWKPGMNETHDEIVDVVRLDDVWDEVASECSRVLLKLDTQGFDLAAFRGAGDLVVGAASPVVALLSEVSLVPIYDGMPTMAEQLAAYGAAGLELAGLYPVSFDRATLRAIELDAVMVRAPSR